MSGGHDARSFAVSRQYDLHYAEGEIPVCVVRTMAGLENDHQNEHGTQVDLKVDIDEIGRTNPKVVSHDQAYKIGPKEQHLPYSGMRSGMCLSRGVGMTAAGGSNSCQCLG